MRSVKLGWVLVFCSFCLGKPSQAIEQQDLALKASFDSASYPQDTPVMLSIDLSNVGRDTLQVLSHVATHETHLDWYTIRLKPLDACSFPIAAGKAPKARTLRLTDARDKSAPVTKTLRPGDFIRHQVNLQTWALRKINGQSLIREGCYQVEVTYTVQREKGAWKGYIRSAPVTLEIRPRS